MSEIVERTLASFPRFLSTSLLGGGKAGPTKQSSPPRGLQALLHAVDNAHSRSEEEAVVYKELAIIKQRLNQPGATVGQLRELLPRIIFCAVIGYDVSFCKIHAIKLAQAGTGMEKRAGYLAATLMLHPGEEVTILTMGTLQRDLASSNMLDNRLALTGAAYLVAAEHIPMILPAVLKCLDHKRELVREKAVHCLHAFFLRAQSLMSHSLPQLNNMLKDKDPGVLSALVSIFLSLAEKDPDAFLPLGLPLLNVLQQVRGCRFPATHDYHGIPLPWLQINLLKILGVLGSRDPGLASTMLTTLADVLREVNPRESISLAVVYQCVWTVAQLGRSCYWENGDQRLENQKETADGRVPDHAKRHGADVVETADEKSQYNSCHSDADSLGPAQVKKQQHASGRSRAEIRQLQEQLQPLFHQASQCVSSFLRSSVHNLRYLGVKSLAQLVSVSAELAVEHQMAVVKCLDDPDPAVRHQTVTLLHHMANPANVKVICSKLLEHMHQKGVDSNLRTDVAQMVCDIAGRLAPDPKWYLDTLLPILSMTLDAKLVSSTAEHMLMYLMKINKHQTWPQFSKYLFTVMIDKVLKAEISSHIPILQFSLQVLRFVPLEDLELEGKNFLAACRRLVEADSLPVETKESVVLCIQHFMIKGLVESTEVAQWVKEFHGEHKANFPRRFQQLAGELHALASLHSGGKLGTSQLLGISRKDMDFTLSFTDGYVSEVLEKGQPLLKRHTAFTRATAGEGASFVPDADNTSSHSPDSHPSMSTASPEGAAGQGSISIYTDRSTVGDSLEPVSTTSSLRGLPGVKQVWSKQGVAANEASQRSPKLQSLSAGSNVQPPTDALTEKGLEVKSQQEELARALFQGISPSPSLAISESASTSTLCEEPGATASTEQSERLQEASNLDISQRYQWETPASILPTADTGGWRVLHKSITGVQAYGPGASDGEKAATGATESPKRRSLENVAKGQGGTFPHQSQPEIDSSSSSTKTNHLSDQFELNLSSSTAAGILPVFESLQETQKAVVSTADTRDTCYSQDHLLHAEDSPGQSVFSEYELQSNTAPTEEQSSLYSEFLHTDFSDSSDLENEEGAMVGREGVLGSDEQYQEMANALQTDLEEKGMLIPGKRAGKEQDFLSKYMLSASPADYNT